MRLCSITITPDGTAKGADAAYESVVALVDEFLTYPGGEISDFAAVRNAALASMPPECDWALVLDSDETLCFTDAPALRGELADTSADVLRVMQADGSYAKDRFFRLPLKGRWVGPTHEAFMDAGTIETLPASLVTFAERAKAPAQLRAKFARDVAILEPYTAQHPHDPRWFYYLGESYAGLGRVHDACLAWEACWELNGWDEESAWAAYRIAVERTNRGDHEGALEWCLRGMQRHPGIAELPFMAGLACYRLGRYQHAAHWAGIALAHNLADGPHGELFPKRTGFRYLPGLFEGPYDVLYWSLKQMGEDGAAAIAWRGYIDAKQMREAA
ncbi:MAG: hypothetical protein AB7R89_34660 [Dehalococcoidia bacterium]